MGFAEEVISISDTWGLMLQPAADGKLEEFKYIDSDAGTSASLSPSICVNPSLSSWTRIALPRTQPFTLICVFRG